MRRGDLDDLRAFAAVAEARSFTRAASALGLSPSALSHAMRGLEERLGVRLLARTTRSVRATEAGERLLASLRPALDEIGAGLAALGGAEGGLSGTVRLTAVRHAATAVVGPALPAFMAAHPGVQVELTVDEGLTDIVRDGYDAGVRFGERVARDMVAIRIGGDMRAAVVASPAYLARHPAPDTPADLAGHDCVNYRLATAGGLWPWELLDAPSAPPGLAFGAGGRTVQVRTTGRLVLNDSELMLAAALAGQGLVYLFEDQVAADCAAGRLVRVLGPWCPAFPGYHIYYPSRRLVPPALAALVAALRVGAGDSVLGSRGKSARAAASGW